MQNATFEIGQSYEVQFIGDSQLRPRFTVTARTAKMVTGLIHGKEYKVKVRFDSQDGEYCLPYGTYSMRPSCYAKRRV